MGNIVHKAKGNDFDYVFIVGFFFDPVADTEIPSIIYTGISRPKKRLFITSSFPKPYQDELDSVFAKGTYEIRNVQSDLVKPFLIRKGIKDNVNFTLSKVQRNLIDSMVVKIKEENCPFSPYIEKSGTKQKPFTSSRRMKVEGSIEYSVEKHHRSGTYLFNFLDLNLLKKNGFTDEQIIQYCVNLVFEFFDCRVEMKDILIHRLDLCKVLVFPDEEELKNFYKETLIPLVVGAKHYSIKDHDSNSYSEESNFDSRGFSPTRGSLYINHHKKKENSLTTVVYNPGFKDNKNRIHIKNLVKIELRGRGKVLEASLLGENPNVERLQKIIGDGKIHEILEGWFSEYLGDWEEWRKK